MCQGCFLRYAWCGSKEGGRDDYAASVLGENRFGQCAAYRLPCMPTSLDNLDAKHIARLWRASRFGRRQRQCAGKLGDAEQIFVQAVECNGNGTDHTCPIAERARLQLHAAQRQT